MKVRVSAIQMDCKLGDVDSNLEKAEKLINEAVKDGAKLIVLPELFSTGYRLDEQYFDYAEKIPDGRTVKRIETIAKEKNVYIVGAIVEKSEVPGLIHDTAFVCGPSGFIGKYRKTHLWDKEKLYFTPGRDLNNVFDIGFCKIGIMICYEAGFPELARRAALNGAEVLVVVAAFGKPRLYAWDLMTKSRALENGCYLIASDRIGKEKDSEFCGHSRIVSPKGDVIKDAELDERILSEEIDLDEVYAQRRRIPYLRDYKKELYQNSM